MANPLLMLFGLFMSAEHVYIGDKIGVKLADTESPQTEFNVTLTNGASMSYGEIMAAGDHYGFEDAPIYAGASLDEREQRFINAFNTLDVAPSAAEEIPKIREVLNLELKTVQAAKAKGIPASVAYVAAADETDRLLNCITGGWCGKKNWWMKMGRTTRLSTVNYDHFGDNAWLTYEAGHRAAMKEAIKARDTHDLSLLRHAYAMNAFACHFLSDRYASGHMRVPRVEMTAHVTPALVGTMLMRIMHDEEGEGLNVHDAYGNQWRAVGDGYYFDNENSEQSRHMMEALQVSADEIFAAYQSGKLVESRKQYDMLPVPDETDRNCKRERAQMFIWDQANNTLFRRADLRNKNSCGWTKRWWGWSTLLELKKINKSQHLNVATQAELAKTSYAQDAVREGLIEDENIVSYVKAKK